MKGSASHIRFKVTFFLVFATFLLQCKTNARCGHGIASNVRASSRRNATRGTAASTIAIQILQLDTSKA